MYLTDEKATTNRMKKTRAVNVFTAVTELTKRAISKAKRDKIRRAGKDIYFGGYPFL